MRSERIVEIALAVAVVITAGVAAYEATRPRVVVERVYFRAPTPEELADEPVLRRETICPSPEIREGK